MKKSLLFFAMIAGMAIGNIACSSSDDNGSSSDEPQVISAPENADKAVQYTVAPEASTQMKQEATTEDGEAVAVQLNTVNFTESNKAVFGLTVQYSDKAKSKFETYNVEYNGNLYQVKDDSGKRLGTIEKVTAANARITRATDNVGLNINVEINVDGIKESVKFESEGTVTAQAVTNTVGSSSTTTSLVRTWKVERLKLVLDFDDEAKTDASRTEKSGSLKPFVDLADKNNVKLSANDRKNLDRTIADVTFDQTGLFTLNYQGSGSDAAKWKWADSAQKFINLKLMDGEMGNKFIQDDSKIEVQWPGNGKCLLILSTRLEEDACTASLQVLLNS